MNKLKTYLFLFIVTFLCIFLGELIFGHVGIYLGVLVAIITDYMAIFMADRAMLSLYKAKKITADSHPDIHASMQAIATQSGLPRPSLYLIDTTASNLFAVGKSPKKASIAISQGLLTNLSAEEQKAVLAQAMAQIQLGNGFVNTATAVVANGLASFAYLGWDIILDDQDPHEKPHFNEKIMRFIGPATAWLIKLMVSKSMQLDADKQAIRWLGDHTPLVSALQKLESLKTNAPFPIADARPSTAHLFIINPLHPKKWALMFQTQPTTALRLAKAQER